jgi:hypothetical protein
MTWLYIILAEIAFIVLFTFLRVLFMPFTVKNAQSRPVRSEMPPQMWAAMGDD